MVINNTIYLETMCSKVKINQSHYPTIHPSQIKDDYSYLVLMKINLIPLIDAKSLNIFTFSIMYLMVEI